VSAVPITIVAAIAENGVIGRDNQLVWRLRSDLKRFRALTWGKPLIMGRKTYESIGRPLPGRETIVLTRDPAFASPGARPAHDWVQAKRLAREVAGQMGASEVAVVGGAEIYRLALSEADRLYLTIVHASPDGDVTFPDFDRGMFREAASESHPASPEDEHPFTFLDLVRRRASAEA
jgi:dihydrofolate reductase